MTVPSFINASIKTSLIYSVYIFTTACEKMIIDNIIIN
jgi:hypothetical protein